MNTASSLVFDHLNSDVNLIVRRHRFSVSSSRMSAISSTFRELFKTQDNLVLKTVLLPSEDPAPFHLICQLAHDVFIPRSDVSLDMLIKLNDIIRRYNIPTTSSIHQTTMYHFDKGIVRSHSVPTPEGTLLRLQVAKSLGSATYFKLLEDMFTYYPLDVEVLSTDPDLGNIYTEGLMCRSEVVAILACSRGASLNQHKTVYELMKWILSNIPSLYEVFSQLNVEFCSSGREEELRMVCSTIEKAIERLRYIFRHTAEVNIANTTMQEEVAKVRTYPAVKRLEVQIACDKQDVEVTSPASSASAYSSDFEDIKAYSGPVVKNFHPYLGLDDNSSISSSETI
jgi:hypothetical protein